MNHRLEDERFADWVDGRLDGDELARLEAELAADPALRAAAEDYKRTVFAVRGALSRGAGPRAGLADRVLALAAADAPARETESRVVPRLRMLPWVGSAAAAAALIAVFVWVYELVGESSAPVTTSADQMAFRAIDSGDAEMEKEGAERSEASRSMLSDDKSASGDRARAGSHAFFMGATEVGDARRPKRGGAAPGVPAAELESRSDETPEPSRAVDESARFGAVVRLSDGERRQLESGGAAAMLTDPAPALVDPGALVVLLELPVVPSGSEATAPEWAAAANGLLGAETFDELARQVVEEPLAIGAGWDNNLLPPDIVAFDLATFLPVTGATALPSEPGVDPDAPVEEKLVRPRRVVRDAPESRGARSVADDLPTRVTGEAAQSETDAAQRPIGPEFSYHPMPNDVAYRLLGESAQQMAYLRRLMTAVKGVGGQTQVQRVGVVAPYAAGRLSVDPAPLAGTDVLLVLRQLQQAPADGAKPAEPPSAERKR